MKNLIIIGAGGYGREVYDLAKSCTEYNRDWTIGGFLDDNPSALDGYNYDIKIIGSVIDYEVGPNDVFICAVGSVDPKEILVNRILEKGGEFINLIHPTANRNSNVKVGKGLIMFPMSGISNDCTVGDFVTMQGFVVIGHDSVIGDHCHLNSHSFVSGNCTIGNKVTLNTACILIPGIKIKDRAIVGAGAVVLRNVKEDTTVFGNPAKVISF